MSDTITAYDGASAFGTGSRPDAPSPSAVETWNKALADNGLNPAGTGDDNGWGDLGGDGLNLEKASVQSDAVPRSVDGPYSPGREGYHDHQAGPNLVCPAQLQCTPQEMADQMSRFSLPGRPSNQPVESGQRYLVRDPATGLPAGYVRTTTSADGLTVQNVTRPLHILYDGQITRTATQYPDGSWWVTTVGVGNNAIPGMATINKEVGPGIFDTLDAQMRRNIELHHRGQ